MKSMRYMLAAALAAALFGASIPLNAVLGFKEFHPVLITGLLYAGSAVGAGSTLILRRAAQNTWGDGIQRAHWPLTGLSIVIGGGLAPIALQMGMARSSGLASSLLGASETVFTAALAWLIFRELFRPAIGLAVTLIVGGTILIGVSSAEKTASGTWLGPLFLLAAYFGWGLDNNLSRKLSHNDPLTLTLIRGCASGVANITLAAALGATFPPATLVLQVLGVGAVGYGISIALLIYAMRGLGAAQGGAWFGAAPFFGALLALALGERGNMMLWIAAVLMAAGIGVMSRNELRSSPAKPA